MHKSLFLIPMAFLSLSPVQAQADPVPFFSPYPHIDRTTWYLSDGWANGDHQSCEWQAKSIIAIDNQTIRLRLSDTAGKTRPYSCGEIQSTTRFGYGRFEARIKTAAGSGLNSAFFTYIGPPQHVKEHDEIDFEFLGKNPHSLQLGYWHDGKNYDAKVIDLGFDPSEKFHDYAFEWTPKSITWFADGHEIYTTSGEHPLPRNPQKLFFSLWSGSDIEDDWLGHFTYTHPVMMDINHAGFTPMEAQKK